MDIDQEEIVGKSKQNESFQIEDNIVEDNETKIMQTIFQKLHFQRKISRGHNKNALY
jgi:ribosomal protein L4